MLLNLEKQMPAGPRTVLRPGWSWFVWDSLSSAELLPQNYPYLTTVYKAAGFFCLSLCICWLAFTLEYGTYWSACTGEQHHQARLNTFRGQWFIKMKHFTTHNRNRIFIRSGFRSSKIAASQFFVLSRQLIEFWQFSVSAVTSYPTPFSSWVYI